MKLECIAVFSAKAGGFFGGPCGWYIEMRFGVDGEQEIGPFMTEALALSVARDIRDLPEDRAPGQPFVFPHAHVPIRMPNGQAAPPHDYDAACRRWS